jgi:hypothetical protein
MSKKKKLKLEDLKVVSFVTENTDRQNQAIKGGLPPKATFLQGGSCGEPQTACMACPVA